MILAALGWKGFWVGGEDLAFTVDQHHAKFRYLKTWITLENVDDLARQGLAGINAAKADVVSLDLDGNDIYFVEKLLTAGILPKVFIVEYNARFPPPVKFQIEYDADHQWRGDDYFGASLSSFVELFNRFDYKLVCCNSHSGANAYFVLNSYSSAFQDVPTQIEEIYAEPRYFLYRNYGHPKSIKTIEKIFKSGSKESS